MLFPGAGTWSASTVRPGNLDGAFPVWPHWSAGWDLRQSSRLLEWTQSAVVMACGNGSRGPGVRMFPRVRGLGRENPGLGPKTPGSRPWSRPVCSWPWTLGASLNLFDPPRPQLGDGKINSHSASITGDLGGAHRMRHVNMPC